MFNHRRLLPLLILTALLHCAFVLALLCSAFVVLPIDAAASAPVAVAPLRFVDEDGAALAGATLRLLCYDDRQNPPELSADLLFTTDQAGFLQQPLPADCPLLAALQVLHRQPVGKVGRDDAYWVYNTSWEPGSRTLIPATGEVIVRSEWRLVLFDLAVALEWEPSAASTYLDELRQGLFAASAALYDATAGQMAFGPLTITTAGAGWDGADIQVRAANDYRPTAPVGGIVAQTTAYTTPTAAQTVYAPGAIVLGRYWDGFDAAAPVAGAWTEPPAYRTILHEWMHYALFLYDEYQELDARGRWETFCTCRDLPQVGIDPQACGQTPPQLAASLMSYHYTASQLWFDGLPAACVSTDQYRVHGEPDWATLARWHTIQGQPEDWLRKPAQTTAGPELGLAGDLFGRRPEIAVAHNLYLSIVQGQMNTHQRSQPQLALTTTNEVTLSVTISAALTLTELNRLHVQLYTLEPATAGRPPRLLYQGTTTGLRRAPNEVGRATLVGIQPETELRVFVTGPAIPGAPHYAFYYSGEIEPAPAQQTIQALRDDTALRLDLQPGLVGAAMQALTVTLSSRTPLAGTPTAQLCTPDAATGCPQEPAWRQTLTGDPANLTWRTVFTAPALGSMPPIGAIQITAPGGAEVIRWFQTLGAVGPGHRWGHAPRRDGLLAVDAITPVAEADNLVLMMPMANIPALAAPLPPGIDGLLGLPLDVDVGLAGAAARQDDQLPAPVVMTFFFGQAELDRLESSTTQTQLLHFRPGPNRWEVLSFSGRSPHLHWLATRPLAEMGIFAVGRASAGFGVTPQMFGDPGPTPVEQPLRFLIALPASTNIMTPTMGTIQNPLPPFVATAEPVTCSLGECFFDPVARMVFWQGEVQAGDLVVLSYDLHIDPGTPPSMLPPVLINQAQAFDGEAEYILTAQTQLQTEAPAARGDVRENRAAN